MRPAASRFGRWSGRPPTRECGEATAASRARSADLSESRSETPAGDGAAPDDAAPVGDVPSIYIARLADHVGELVELRGWVDKRRSSGKIGFLELRDGSPDTVQGVVSRKEVDESSWEAMQAATQESTVRLVGRVVEDARAPSGYELHVSELEVLQATEEYPITPKEHGTAFLMENRHLWLRSSRQRAILRVRSAAIAAIREFFDRRDYVLIDSPILTPAACEGTSTLFETDYFGDPAYLSQSGQLYLEPAAAAFGKVYCFGPTFRAEKSKTRRHLMEFWMVEPEVAFLEFDGLCALAEEFLAAVVGRVLERCRGELESLERDVSVLERVQAPFPRMRYREAIELLQGEGKELQFGDDFGAEEETILASQFDRPLMITHYPVASKAFYMQPDAEDPELALALDVIAPEGYGEIIGGSQRIHDHDLLARRIDQHELPRQAFQWYLDIRRYGAFPHSGFGMGLERFVAWLTRSPHLRETIPYPRMLHKIYP
ncbi:MAG: asparagine--tRNA ligase [Acidobacteria bacterium]|nr:MAG: asparagine--tRNA ligase [Acidobacteriota bacterium]